MKQKQVKLPSGGYNFYGLKEPVNKIEFYSTEAFGNYLDIWCKDGSFYAHRIPPGSWQLLGADPTALTEVEAGEIVGKVMEVGGVYHWYTDYQNPTKRVKAYATASLDSLAASLGISKPYVILKLKTDNNDK